MTLTAVYPSTPLSLKLGKLTVWHWLQYRAWRVRGVHEVVYTGWVPGVVGMAVWYVPGGVPVVWVRVSHCTGTTVLYCTVPASLYWSHCTALYRPHCTGPTVPLQTPLYRSHCTTADTTVPVPMEVLLSQWRFTVPMVDLLVPMEVLLSQWWIYWSQWWLSRPSGGFTRPSGGFPDIAGLISRRFPWIADY